MPNGEQQQTNGGPGVFSNIENLSFISGVSSLIKGRPKQVFTGLEIPSLDIVSARDQKVVQTRIDAAIAAGNEPTAADLAALKTIKEFRASQAALFQRQQELFPDKFQGVPLGTTIPEFLRLFAIATGRLEELTAFFSDLPEFFGFGPPSPAGPPGIPTPPGARGRDPGFSPTGGARGTTPRATPASRGLDAAKFIACLMQSLLPSRTGGKTMPFVTTPGFAPTTGSLDFGSFGGILQSGLQLARNIFAPSASVQPINGRQFDPVTGSFLPAVVRNLPRVARQLPGFAGGVIGGELAERAFGSLFGGADDLDESASFTDPIPGKCRPKAHVKTNPCTGKGVWFTPRGKPLVFSGDMAACKRVDRVAKRLEKARPKRRHHHHARTRHPR